jgi:hypothetical membrane protein
VLTQQNETLNSPLAARLLIMGGAIGSLLFILVLLVEGATRPGYDAWRMAGSALSLSDRGWMQIANFIVGGLLILGFAVGVRQTLGRGRGAAWGPILLAIAGMGLIIAGIFVTDPAFGYPPGTPGGPTLHTTWHGALHFFLGGLAFFIGLSAACFVFARRFASDPHWRGWVALSVTAGVIVLAFLVAYAVVAASVPGGGSAGFLERISIITGLAWIALFAFRLLSQIRLSDSSGRSAVKREPAEHASSGPAEAVE